MRWQGAFRSTYTRVTECCIGGNVGGRVFPLQKLPRCPGHAGAENGPASPSSSSLVLGITKTGSPAGLPWPVMPCGTSAVLPLWLRLSNSISPLPIAHVVSSCALPSIQPPYPPYTTSTAPVTSAAPGRKFLLPSSVARTPPPTGSPPPGMGGRLCRLSSRHYSAGPPYQTGRPGY